MKYDSTILKESFENAQSDDRWYSTFLGEAERCLRTLIPSAEQTSGLYKIAGNLFNGHYDFDDLVQDCLSDIWVETQKGILNYASERLDLFIVQTAAYRLLHYVEKETRRKKIATFKDIDEMGDTPYFDSFDDEEELTEVAEKLMAYEPGEKDKDETIIQAEKDTYRKIAEFKTIGEAVKATGVNKANLSLVLSGKRKTAGGYIWVKSSNPLVELLKEKNV